MGQRMQDEPIEYGINCLQCWPDGLTPKYLYARFALVTKRTDHDPDFCSMPPNDVVFKLTQDPGEPCAWFYDQGNWTVRFDLVNLGIGNTEFTLDDTIGNHYFHNRSDTCYSEGTVLHNDIPPDEPGACGYDGFGIVTWTPQATDLLAAINMSKAYDLFMEIHPRDDGKIVYKFCKLQDATNVKILFDPTI